MAPAARNASRVSIGCDFARSDRCPASLVDEGGQLVPRHACGSSVCLIAARSITAPRLTRNFHARVRVHTRWSRLQASRALRPALPPRCPGGRVRTVTRIRLSALAVVAAVACLAALTPAVAQAATYRVCDPVRNPYAGTRYDGVDLSRIRALGVSCRRARQVARGAHRRALGMTPSLSGIRTFTWGRWRVTGDIRGSVDRYIARARGGKRVRWRF
jgi:hypothetical protein